MKTSIVLPPPTVRTILVVLIALFGIAIRLFLALSNTTNFDLGSYSTVAKIMQSGGIVYEQTPFYNYSPLWSYWLLGCWKLSSLFHLAFTSMVRLSLSCADMVNAVLVYQIMKKTNPNMTILAFALYCLNPGAIINVSYHGQFETLAMLPILLAVYLQFEYPGLTKIWLLGTLAIVIKQIVLFSVFTLFVYAAPTKRRAVLMMIISIIIFLLTFTPYLTAQTAILTNVFGHTGSVGTFGISLLLPEYFVVPFFGLVMTVIPFLSKYKFNLSLVKGLHISALAFIIFSPGFFAHYFELPLVTGSLLPGIWSGIFSFFCLDNILHYQFNTGFPIPIFFFTWFVAVAWLGSSFFSIKPPESIKTEPISR